MKITCLLSLLAASALAQENNNTDAGADDSATASNATLYNVIAEQTDLTKFAAAADSFRLVRRNYLGRGGASNFTVFAPTDAAFETVDPKFLTDSYRQHLKTIIDYHDTGSSVTTSADIVNASIMNTFGDDFFTFRVADGTVTLFNEYGEATVVEADIEADNGILHKIDNVLIPPIINTNLVDQAADFQSFTMALELVELAGLGEEFRANDQTIFVPSNEAFNKLGEGVLDGWKADLDTLKNVLRHHVLTGVYTVNMMYYDNAGKELPTIGGGTLLMTANLTEDVLYVQGVPIDEDSGFFDVPGSNGVGTVVETLLLPPGVTGEAPTDETTSGDDTDGDDENEEASADDTDGGDDKDPADDKKDATSSSIIQTGSVAMILGAISYMF